MIEITQKKLAASALNRIHSSTEWFNEPALLFSANRLAFDPKVGIALYGPRSYGTTRHKSEVHLGFIGLRESIERAQQFYTNCANGVDGDDEHIPFPGFRADRGFRSDLIMDQDLVELITRHEEKELLSIKNSRTRFETMVALLSRKMELLCQRDRPLDHIVLVLSDELYKKCRVTTYKERGSGEIHRDLRRAFKAVAMRFQKATQILLETTTGLVAVSASGKRKPLDHASVIAWNLFTGLYFKVDGMPWSPAGLTPGTCFIGISFFRPLGEASTLRTSVVQAFDENGEGLVLRGHNFHWDESKQGRSPHLSAELASQLVNMVLDRYQSERKCLPQKVVVHKSSRFEPEEREGFAAALKRVNQFDLVALTPTSEIRLIRSGLYPPLRGTCFDIGDISFLYTTGYSTVLERYPHGHVPSPLQVSDHFGDTSKRQLLREVMLLTKMNWNSANLGGLLPITLRFSRLVGDILREVPVNQEPDPRYKFYT